MTRELAIPATLTALAFAQVAAGRAAQLTGRGVPIEERSRAARGLLTPPDGAFAIWGPIFAGNLLHAVRSGRADPALRPVQMLAAAAFAGNTAWSAEAQFRGLTGRSVVIIASTAASAATGFVLAARAGDRTTGAGLAANTLGPLAGWLTVATALNVESTADAARGRPPVKAERARALGLLTVAVAAEGAIAWAGRGNLPHALAAGWGLGGVALRARREGNRPLATAALVGLAGLAATALFARRRDEPESV